MNAKARAFEDLFEGSINREKEFKTIAELIQELKKYPQDMRVATEGLPHSGVYVRKCRCESISGRFEDFDYIGLI